MPDLTHLRNVIILNSERFTDDFWYSSVLEDLVIEVQTSASGSVGWVYQEWDFPIKPVGNWRRLYAGSQLYECERLSAEFKLGFYLWQGLNDLNVNVWKPPNVSNDGNIGDIKDGFWIVPPDNWKLLNGDILQRSDYPEFWEWANNWHNGIRSWEELYGLDVLTVKLPDCRKDFFRMASNEHPLGEWQSDEFKEHDHGKGNHRHEDYTPGGGSWGWVPGSTGGGNGYVGYSGDIIQPEGGEETHPRNTSVNVAIRVKE